MGTASKEAGGVCFHTHCEQIVQIADHGSENIVSEIVLTRAERNWSEGSSKSLLEEFGADLGMADLAMAMLQGCAAADSGIRIF